MKSAAFRLGVLGMFAFMSIPASGAVTGVRFDSPIAVSDGMQIDLDDDGIIEVTLTRQTAVNPGAFPLIASYFMNGILLGPDTETLSRNLISLGAGNTVHPLTVVLTTGEDISAGAGLWDQYPAHYKPSQIAAQPAGGLLFSSINILRIDQTYRANTFDPYRYIPLRWERNDNTFYGWIELSADEIEVGPDQYEHPFFYHGYGYETEPGVGLLAGQVPEPASIAFLTACTWPLLRRREQCVA